MMEVETPFKIPKSWPDPSEVYDEELGTTWADVYRFIQAAGSLKLKYPIDVQAFARELRGKC